jgi:transposase
MRRTATRRHRVPAPGRHGILHARGELSLVETYAAEIACTGRSGFGHVLAQAYALLSRLAAACARISLVRADGGYAGKLLGSARDTLHIGVQIVTRTDDMTGFVVLPRRRVVERTLAWITRHHRSARDYEALPTHYEAMIC